MGWSFWRFETSVNIDLHNLELAEGSTRNRKRVGRGQDSGTGKTTGRGNKGKANPYSLDKGRITFRYK